MICSTCIHGPNGQNVCCQIVASDGNRYWYTPIFFDDDQVDCDVIFTPEREDQCNGYKTLEEVK